MIARLYANENFPLPVVIALRELGHDVLTSSDAGKANDAIPDEEVLRFAVGNGRAVITHNRRDFLRLHGRNRTTKASLSARTMPISPRSQPKSTLGFRRWNLSKASWCGSIAERKPQRCFCFDRLTGDLWLADVGQDRVEEVDIVHRGENHGWNVFEGFEPFSNQYRKEGRTFSKPVFAYRRKYGNSITGGHVYRGHKNSSFYGAYICGDYNSKRIFAITQQNGALQMARQIGSIPQRLVSFSEDEAGNIYAVGYEGTIYQLDFTEARLE